MMCTICFRKNWPWPHDKVTTECNHSYCRKCLINWVKSENWACNKCPVCRGYLNQEWRNMLLTDRLPVMPSRPKTRLFLAKERVQRLLANWEADPRVGEHSVEMMYDLAKKIRNEKIIFNNDSRFKRIYNCRMKNFAESYDEKFLDLLVE